MILCQKLLNVFLSLLFAGLPETDSTPVNNILMNTIDNLFGTDPSWGSRIILRNESEECGFSMLPTPLSFVLDQCHNRIGINIPKKVSSIFSLFHYEFGLYLFHFPTQQDQLKNKLICSLLYFTFYNSSCKLTFAHTKRQKRHRFFRFRMSTQ